MWVIDLENAPERLRGTLARWGVEVRAGLYVGSAGVRMREAIWATVLREADATTSAVMIWDATGPQGFDVWTHGPNRREIVDADGLWLARYIPRVAAPAGEGQTTADPAPPDEPPFDPDEVYPEFLEP
jgi:CRISPR-associated protein Cas2